MIGSGDFAGLVDGVCRRPGMYVVGGSFLEVAGLITGYALGAPDCPLGGDGWAAFNAFVTATLRMPSNLAWPSALSLASRDDAEAIARLRDLLIDFARRATTQPHEAIVAEARASAGLGRDDEAGPVRAWRRFARAILRARRDEIEPLILDHPGAEVLWSAAYPADVAGLLDEIRESAAIRCVAGSVAAGDVTLITPDYGPVGVRLVAGAWRIDASPIIATWSARARES